MANPKSNPPPKAKAAQSAGRSTRAAAEPPKTGRGGIARPVTPSPALGAIVGAEPLTRAELTRRVWDYIKSHDLQDANDRRQINADAALKAVLGKDQVSMFESKRSGNPILVNRLTPRETGPDSLQSGVHEWIRQIVRCRNGVRFGKTTWRSGKPVG